MKRRVFAINVLIVFIMTTCAFTFKFDSVNPIIRVGLRNMTASSIDITLSGSYNVNGSILSSGTSFNISLLNNKIIYQGVGYDELVFTPTYDSNLIKLEIGPKRYSYRGTMDFTVSRLGIVPINIIDIETYLKGVVGYEMSNSYPIEALKAQAVAARNYALTDIGKHKGLGYDLCDTTDCQVYKGYDDVYTKVISAVDETKGKVLVYGDELVCAYYSASTGGYTEASGNIWSKQLPYLISKKDDMESENWPYGNQTFTTLEADARLKSKGFLKSTDKLEKIDIDSIKRNESGRVASIDIVYLNSSNVEIRKSITKEGPRTFLSLPSTLYNIVYDITTDKYTFSGKGYGHAVGMSQIGAKNRANAGQTYDMILSFYYDSTSIVDMSSSIINDNSDTTGQGIDIVIPDTTIPGIILVPKTTGTSIVIPPKVPVVINTIPAKSTNPTNIAPPKTTSTAISVIPKANENPIKTVVQTGGSTVSSANSNFSFLRELKKGMSGEDVKRLQDGLKKLKYLSVTNTTNYFGVSTEKSLKVFQKKNGLKVNGKGDKLTLAKLSNILTTTLAKETALQKVKVATSLKSTAKAKVVLATNKVLKLGMKGSDIIVLQTALKTLGYFKANANGVFGPATQAAVKLFQKVNALASIGNADYSTLNKINQKMKLMN